LETPDDTPNAIDGVEVQVTDDVGPAVAGLFRPHILAPGWVVALPESERSIFLVHEQEHIRGGDPWSFRVARAACTLLPWNPIVWLLSLRLVRAIECDCDRRVLRRIRRGGKAQGNALLEISARGTSRPFAAATMACVVLGISLLAGALEVPLPPVRLRVEVGQAPSSPEVAAIGPTRAVAAAVPERPTPRGRVVDRPTQTRRPPALRNAGLVRRTLLDEYPRELRARGIGGTVFLAVLVGPNGKPLDRRLGRTSGHPALDEAALRMVDDMRFTPARRRDSQASVWVDQQITFSPGAADPSRFDHHPAR
jgi:TonB family protein